jgi:hypothetical protein
MPRRTTTDDRGIPDPMLPARATEAATGGFRRVRIVAFDQIAVVGIHDSHCVSQIRGCERMQKLTENGDDCR